MVTIVMKPKQRFEEIYEGYDHDIINAFVENLCSPKMDSFIEAGYLDSVEKLILDTMNPLAKMYFIQHGIEKTWDENEEGLFTDVSFESDEGIVRLTFMDVDGDHQTNSIGYDKAIRRDGRYVQYLPTEVKAMYFFFSQWCKHNLFNLLGGNYCEVNSREVVRRSSCSFQNHQRDSKDKAYTRGRNVLVSLWQDGLKDLSPWKLAEEDGILTFQLTQGDSIYSIYRSRYKSDVTGTRFLSWDVSEREDHEIRGSEQQYLGRCLISRDRAERFFALTFIGESLMPKYHRILNGMPKVNEQTLERIQQYVDTGVF